MLLLVSRGNELTESETTMTTKYYAIADANGLISHELDADTLSGAIDELKAAVANDDETDWTDNGSCDLEDAAGCCCDGMSINDALDCCCASCGGNLRLVWGDNTSDSWDIWELKLND